MELVTLKAFDNSIEAHVSRSKLESQGIQAFLFDENIIAMNPLYNNAIGGIKLKVAEVDVAAAIEILAKVDATPLTDEAGKVITCPNCGSVKITAAFKSMKEAGAVMTLIFSLLFLLFPLYYKSVKKCNDCDHEF